MIIPIYERETTLYGNDGKYVLIKKEGNQVTYKFVPWDEARGSEVMKKKDIKQLGDILNVRILWAVYEDI